MTKNSFVFYETFFEQLNVIEDSTIKAKFYEAIIQYGLFGTEPNFSGLELALWIGIKKDIDYAQDRRQTQQDNGKKGGRPLKTQKNPTETQKNPNESENNLNVYVNEDVYVYGECEGDVKAETRTQFDPFKIPTRQEVDDFVKNNDIIIDIEKFYNHYESVGWQINGRSVVNWQALIKSWQATDLKNNPNAKTDAIKQQQQEKNNAIKKNNDTLKRAFLKDTNGLCKCGAVLSDYSDAGNAKPEFYCKTCATSYVLRGDTWIDL